MLERAEKQSEILRVVIFSFTGAVQREKMRDLFTLGFFSPFSQAQSETHMSKQILLGGNEAVCMVRRR